MLVRNISKQMHNLFGSALIHCLGQFLSSSYQLSKDWVQKRLKRTKLGKTTVFENLCFVVSSTINVEHQVSQENPKTAKKAPKTAPEIVQEPFKKSYTIHPVCYPEMVTKIGPEVVQQSQKVGTQHEPNMNKKHTKLEANWSGMEGRPHEQISMEVSWKLLFSGWTP